MPRYGGRMCIALSFTAEMSQVLGILMLDKDCRRYDEHAIVCQAEIPIYQALRRVTKFLDSAYSASASVNRIRPAGMRYPGRSISE